MGIISNLLFGDNSNKTSYKDAATQKAYSQITADTFDRQYGDMTDYLDKNYEGGSGAFKTNLITGLEDNARNSLAQYKANKNNYFGNGFIGSLLNPIAQTVGGIGDLAGLGISGGKANAWDGSNDYLGDKRDIGSDLGAGIETALTIAPLGKAMSLAKAGKAASAGTATAKQMAKLAASQAPKSIGQKMASGALLGAGFGASGSLRDMGFENFDAGQFGLSTALGAGIGGGLAGLGGLWNKYTQPAGAQNMANTPLSSSKELAVYSGPKATGEEYQNALKVLNENKIDLTSPEAMKKTYRAASMKLHPDRNGGVDTMFKQLNNANNLIYDDDSGKMLQNILRASKGSSSGATATSIPKQSFGQKLSNLKTNLGNTKAGTKVSSLLKTKKGKVLAGAGGGLLLAQLLKNKGQNANTMSDEELQELYNYIYGGGQ